MCVVIVTRKSIDLVLAEMGIDLSVLLHLDISLDNIDENSISDEIMELLKNQCVCVGGGGGGGVVSRTSIL